MDMSEAHKTSMPSCAYDANNLLEFHFAVLEINLKVSYILPLTTALDYIICNLKRLMFNFSNKCEESM